MRAVNLLPRDVAPKSSVKKEQIPFVVGGCIGLVVTALIASQFLSQSGKVATERQNLKDVKAQLAALPAPPPGPTPEQTQLVGEQATRLTALQTALQTRVAWDRVLREFSLVLPGDVWLTRLNLKSPISPATNQAPDGSGAATGLTIEGSTYSHDAVARLLSRLSVVPVLTNVQLVNSAAGESNGQKIVRFNIAADIRGATPAAATPEGGS
jgi:type IV pilus assembly PilN-like protein